MTNRFPIAVGCVGDEVVSVLRDTGCNGVIVKRQFVQDEQLTGDVVNMTLLDMSTVRAPLAKIVVDCPYYKGEVMALCVSNSLHDLIIGNVDGAKMPIDGEIQAAAVTGAQANTKAKEPKSLKVNDGSKWLAVNSSEFKTAQEADGSLNHLREMNARKVKGEGTAYFKVENGLLYRFYQHPNVNSGKEVRQLVVPNSLSDKTMEIAHDSFVGGHMGIKKTSDKILLSNFLWPGLKDDVKRFCRSCDVCQKTVNKGQVSRVPLQITPVIHEPFKRVAIDLIGPIHPPSEAPVYFDAGRLRYQVSRCCGIEKHHH